MSGRPRRRPAAPAGGPEVVSLLDSRGDEGGSVAAALLAAGLPPPAPLRAAGNRRAAKRKAAPLEPPPQQQLQQPAPELWADRHAPRIPADLVVHRKKVEEVRAWLAAQAASLAGAAPAPRSRALVVAGPPGCGKSAAVAALAAEAGFAVAEWRPPAPTLWEEAAYAHGGAAGWDAGAARYTSKLNAFEEFALRAKMPALALRRGGGSDPQAGAVAPRPKLVVLDDLPHTAGPDARRRLAAAVGDLARCARFPVVVVATEAAGRAGREERVDAGLGGGGGGALAGLPRELAAALDAAGAAAVSFNPLTVLNVLKALRAALAAEGRALPDAVVTAVAERADGDLRAALGSLQFLATGAAAAAPPAPKQRRRRAATDAAAAADVGDSSTAAAAGAAGAAAAALTLRDASLSLFHGLGKLLYNKRLPASAAAASSAPASATGRLFLAAPAAGALAPAPWAARAPMDGFDPEAVLAAAGLDAGGVAAFLHENIPDFVAPAAIADLAGAAECLSAADVLCGGWRLRAGGSADLAGDDVPSAPLADAAAASVAARGACFWNAHPAPRRFHPMRAPALFAAARAVRGNAGELARAALGRVAYGGAHALEPGAVAAAEVLPALRHLAATPAGAADAALALQQPAVWWRYWHGRAEERRLHAGWGAGGEASLEVNGAAALEEDVIEEV
jgi:cell cycle checkpoint protein